MTRPGPVVRAARIVPPRRIMAVLVLLVVLPLGAVAPAAADERSGPPATPAGGTAPTTLPELPGDAGRIISRPNSGQAPDDPGDPGGWQQTMLLLIVIGAIVLMSFLVWRESKRKRARTA